MSAPPPRNDWATAPARRMIGCLVAAELLHLLALATLILVGWNSPQPPTTMVLTLQPGPGAGATHAPPGVPRHQPQARRETGTPRVAVAVAAASRIAQSQQVSQSSPDRAMPPAPATDAPPEAAKGSAGTPFASAAAPPDAASAPDPAPPGVGGLEAPAPRLPVAEPARLSYRLTGRVGGLSYYANGALSWKQDGENYELSMTISAFLLGSRTQRSVGRINGTGLHPVRFVDQVHEERSVDFQAEDGRIVFSTGAAPVPWFPDAQDQLSVIVQLGSLLVGAQPRYAVGDEIELSAVGVYGPERWRFRIAPPELLTMGDQSMQTTKAVRAASPPDQPSIEVWFSQQLGGLPVRLRLSQANGDTVDQMLSGMEAPK